MVDKERMYRARVIAYYLPQYHPIPENDEWWGKGFTEWTNVACAKPLFRGHYQPRIPADLSFYDLRLPEVREAQAEMARNAGVEGFAYWHYWFAGKRILERPFQEVLKSGKPDFPFCLAWANQTWSGVWHGNPHKILIKQTYPGKTDYENHFNAVLEAFYDKRYIWVENKPLFIVNRPFDIPDVRSYIDLWNNFAIKNGLKGIYFVGMATDSTLINKIMDFGFLGVNSYGMTNALKKIENNMILKIKMNLMTRVGGIFLNKYNYYDVINNFFVEEEKNEHIYPTVLPQWDNSPRSGRRSLIITGSNPNYFKIHLEKALELIQHKSDEHKIVFLKSWNEWAEGNYVEPDIIFKYGYLDALKNTFTLGANESKT